MPKVAFWSKEFRRYLTLNYRYESDTGFVYKQDMASFDPDVRSVKVGSVAAATGEWSINVSFGGKINGVRLIKLAVLLKTGGQHQKFRFKDENILNTKWENIEVLDDSCHTEEEWAERMTAQADRLAAAKRLKKLEQAELDSRLANDPTMVRLSAHKFKQLTPEQVERKEAKEKEVEKRRIIKEQADEFLRHHPKGYVEYTNEHTDAAIITKEQNAMVARFVDPIRPTFYLHGLYSGIDFIEARNFWNDCNKYTGIDYGNDYKRCIDDWMVIQPSGQFQYEGAIKWQSDRAYHAYYMYHYSVTENFTFIAVENVLKDYRWFGAVVAGPYEKIPFEVQQAMAAEERAIFARDDERCRIRAEEVLARAKLKEEQAAQQPALGSSEQPALAVSSSSEAVREQLYSSDSDAPIGHYTESYGDNCVD